MLCRLTRADPGAKRELTLQKSCSMTEVLHAARFPQLSTIPVLGSDDGQVHEGESARCGFPFGVPRGNPGLGALIRRNWDGSQEGVLHRQSISSNRGHDVLKEGNETKTGSLFPARWILLGGPYAAVARLPAIARRRIAVPVSTTATKRTLPWGANGMRKQNSTISRAWSYHSTMYCIVCTIVLCRRCPFLMQPMRSVPRPSERRGVEIRFTLDREMRTHLCSLALHTQVPM